MKTSTSAVRALTVRQPHTHLLIHGSPTAGIKDMENRSKLTSHRRTLLIQASAKIDQVAYAEYIAEGVELPQAEDLVTGAITGPVQVIGCVRYSRSRRAMPGFWHWQTTTPSAAVTRTAYQPAINADDDERVPVREGAYS